MMEAEGSSQVPRSSVPSRLLDHRSVSLVEDHTKPNKNKKDALSSTRMGKRNNFLQKDRISTRDLMQF